MNIFSIIGLVGTFVAVVIGILWGGSSIFNFLDLPSFFIVVIGSMLIVMYGGARSSEALGLFKILGMTFRTPDFKEQQIARKLMAFSEKARREGLLSLEEELEDVEDEFLKIGLRLSIDGTDRDIIMNLLEIEINKMQERHGRNHNVLDLWGTVAPATGMWGTIIGLIAMMRNLNDPDSVGPNMAIALITTLYGSIIANGVAIPAARKLRTYDDEETNVREMIIEGVLSIQAGDNPRILGQKVLAYLNPADRKALERDLKND